MEAARPDPVDDIVHQWRERLPGVDPSPLLVVGRVQRLAARWDSLLRPPFAAAGLTAGDFDVLAALRRSDAGALPSTELATVMLVTAGAATKRIDRLLAAGLVTRDRSTVDGRGRMIALTPAGRRLADQLIHQHLAVEEGLLTTLEPADRTVLATLLSRLLVDAELRTDQGDPR